VAGRECAGGDKQAEAAAFGSTLLGRLFQPVKVILIEQGQRLTPEWLHRLAETPNITALGQLVVQCIQGQVGNLPLVTQMFQTSDENKAL
jgi:hypothetical protein